jgi:predicted DNA-binding transcriptional regulator YafY
MAGNANQKLKILFLLKILQEETDEDHALGIADLIAKLKGYDIQAERKSVYADMELLKRYGIDIVEQHSHKKILYCVGERDFSKTELQVLVDAVRASKSLSAKRSVELIRKIGRLTSAHQSEEWTRTALARHPAKSTADNFLYSSNMLQQAIDERKKVAFDYCEYAIRGGKAEKEYRNRDGKYVVCPHSLVWVNDRYYLISYYDKRPDGINNFRVDRMEHVDLLDECAVDFDSIPAFKDFDPDEYTKGTFGMFTGKPVQARLRFDPAILNQVVDQFGPDVRISKDEEGGIVARVRVTPSPVFFGWMFGFGEQARILEPKELVQGMRAHLDKVSARY